MPHRTRTLNATRVALTLAILLLAGADTALAHTPGGATQGLTSGLLHPFTGLDHVLAMVAVGLWGAQLGRPAAWLLPVVFPMVMALGGVLGLLDIKLPGVEFCIALSALALGFAVSRAVQPRLAVAATVVGFFAIFHGHAHGAELPPDANGILYSIGVVTATAMLHALGLALGQMQRWPAGRVGLRAAGAAVAIAGAVFLWRVVQ